MSLQLSSMIRNSLRGEPATRRTTRYVVRARAQAVDVNAFSLIGERVLDASAEGCLIACDQEVHLGQKLLVSFQLSSSGLWFDAESEIVRIVQGHRDGDTGYCAGVRFTSFERSTRLALGVDLREHPRVAAQRSPKARLRALALSA